MLVTYLLVMLLLISLLGVTIGGMFKNQYIDEKESELQREAEEINTIVIGEYIDPDKRAVAKDQLMTVARKYEALLQLFFSDQTLGKVSFMDESSLDVWEPINDVDLSENAVAVMASSGVEFKQNLFTGVTSLPLITLQRPLLDADGNVIGALFFHADMSRTNSSIRQVLLDVILSALIAVILAFLSVSYITGRMTRPITDMNKTVMKFAKGDFDARVETHSRDEVGQLGESFNTMADELNALEQSRRSFVANVSHELRSPITSMRGFLEAMQDGTIPTEEYGKYLDIVIGECKRMTGMVNDLLDLARIESGSYELKLEAFDVNELMIRTLLTFEARINAKHIDVGTEFDSEHTTVEADPSQIAQVIRNLIDNAIKFSPDGGKLTLGIKTGEMKGKAVVYVRDSGQGITSEDLPHVFDRFYKGEKAHTPSGSSSGLGLSIVKRIIEQHGESIKAESIAGEGATFTFTLKLGEQTARARTLTSQWR